MRLFKYILPIFFFAGFMYEFALVDDIVLSTGALYNLTNNCTLEQSYSILGEDLFEKRKYKQAFLCLDKSVSLSKGKSSHHLYLFLRGFAYEELNCNQAAVLDYSQAINENPQDKCYRFFMNQLMSRIKGKVVHPPES